jgi:hypothetical protein
MSKEFRLTGRDSLSAPTGRRSFLLCPPLRVTSEWAIGEKISGFHPFWILITYEKQK